MSSQIASGHVGKGLFAFAASTVGKYALGIFRIAVLARLLTPEAFGLMSLAVLFVRGLETVAALGPDKLLVQRARLTLEIIETTWIFRMALGALVAVAAFLLAPAYESYTQPGAGAIVSIVALAAIARGLKSPGALLAEREMRFQRVALFELGVSAVEVLVVIGLALTVGGVKALAWGLVVSAVLETGTSFLVFRIRVWPRFHADALREILGVGRHFIVIAVGSFLMVQGDNLLVGKMLGAALLGHYVVAYRLCELPLQFSQQVISRVALSAYSRLQLETGAKQEAFLVALELQTTLLFVMAGYLAANAGGLVNVLYGREYQLAVDCLRALSVVTLWRGFSNVVAPFLVANGHFAFVARTKILEVAAFGGGVYAGVCWNGLVGAALGAGCGYGVAAGVRVLYLIKVEELPWRKVANIFVAAAGLAAPATVVGWAVDTKMSWPWGVRLSVASGIFILMVGICVRLFRPSLIETVRQAIRKGKKT